MAAPKKDRSDSTHPTRELLLATANGFLDEMPADEITVAMVLSTSGVSQGSLYHHFRDFPDLLDNALARRYRAYVDESLIAVAEIAAHVHSREDAQRAMTAIHRDAHSPERRANRLERARIVAISVTHPNLARAIAATQAELTLEWARIIAEGQSRGWYRSDLDPRAIATMLQALTMGRIVDDVVDEPVDPDAWIEVSSIAVNEVLFGS